MRPQLQLIDEDLTARITAEALEVLATLGMKVEDEGAVELLLAQGATMHGDGQRVLLGHEVVESALAMVPKSFSLFDVHGRRTHDFSPGNVHFVPASSAITILDSESGASRRPVTADFVRYAKLVAGLPHIDAQSTAFIPADVPEEISDSYRLFLSLLHCAKPVVTGTFSDVSFPLMREMQWAIRGGAKALAESPLCIFTCCPTSPLRWTGDSARTLMGCARASIPVEIVSVPMAGFISPVTQVGTLIQQTVENLAGVVIHQLANPGAPVLWGCCAAIFDVRYETAPMGAVETMMLAAGSAAVGAGLGLPTQAYIGLSDAKSLDVQAGIETSMGATLAALAGINNVSGPGMLDFINTFSLDKLVVDHEVCAMVKRLVTGIEPREDFPAAPLLEELERDQHLLIADHSRRHLRAEITFPGPVIDRSNRARWIEDGGLSLRQRAAAEVERLLNAYEPPGLAPEVEKELEKLMEAECKKHGLERLPGRSE